MTREFEFRSNWKNVAENFLETYHTHWIHTGLVNRYASLYKGDRDTNDTTRTRLRTGPFFTSHLDLAADLEIESFGLPRIEGQPEVWSRRLEYFFLFPNLIGFVEPGGVVSIHGRRRVFSLLGDGITRVSEAGGRIHAMTREDALGNL